MKTLKHLWLCLGLVLSLSTTVWAANIKLQSVPRLDTPPAGKALINIHQLYQTGFLCAHRFLMTTEYF